MREGRREGRGVLQECERSRIQQRYERAREMLLRGSAGVAKSRTTARELFKKAADLGNAAIDYNLGTMMIRGEGGSEEGGREGLHSDRDGGEEGQQARSQAPCKDREGRQEVDEEVGGLQVGHELARGGL